MTTSFESFKIRYDLKRTYFTLLIPVVLAILIVAIPLVSGLTQVQDKSTEVQDERMKAYEELVRAVGDGGSMGLPPETKEKQGPAIPLDFLVIFGVLVAITPFAIDMTLYKRRLRQKEELFAEFLFKLSELMRGGLDPVKAVTELARTDLGALTGDVQIAATGLTFGKTFDEAMREMAHSMGSDLIRRYVELVIQASTSGGSVSDLILRASEDMRSIIAIEREKEGNLAQYTFIFYFAQAILVFIAYTLSANLLTYVQQLGSQTIFGENQIANLNFRQGFFHLLMINSFFGGLIIGKISEGEAKYGLKHAVILMVTCLIACTIFILPVPKPVVSQNLTISVISGDGQKGIPGLSLPEGISFQVTDKEGNPMKDIEVTFTVNPSGKATPPRDGTNGEGITTVNVQLGTSPGIYRIIAEAEGMTAQANVTALSEGGGG
ncbi:MAG TPA: type II secretion system F family protein [Methanomicrobiales archaeon]|nr:type II secretion system F family protein [Methanomicrobiales archaeon]